MHFRIETGADVTSERTFHTDLGQTLVKRHDFLRSDREEVGSQRSPDAIRSLEDPHSICHSIALNPESCGSLIEKTQKYFAEIVVNILCEQFWTELVQLANNKTIIKIISFSSFSQGSR